ncbi:TPA: ISNCY family transposase [Citrobacter youngae]
MPMAEFGIFTMKDVDRLRILQDVIDRKLRPGQAARQIGVTAIHFSRLLRRYREFGPLGMSNQQRGKPGNRKTPAHIYEQVVKFLSQKAYSDFGPTFAGEQLSKELGIQLSKETLRKMMIHAGLWVPRKLRAPKIQQPRYRRACTGELIQIDGCDHHWFEDRARPCTLLVYVDDATSRLMHLRFVLSESTFSYYEATRGYLEKHGKPLALYSDKASVFRINNKHATNGDGYTQFGRAMYELNIQTICAETSSAKGRVERAHLTLQDRLVKEMRLRNISSITEANDYVEEFMEDYNRRFAKTPRHDFDVHRPLEADDLLDDIFTWREPRKVSSKLTIQHDKMLYLIEDSEYSRRAIGKYIDTWLYPDGHVELKLNGVALPYRIYDRLSQIDQGDIIDNKRLSQVLQVAKLVQEQRDNRRSRALPSVDGPDRSRNRMKIQKKSQRSLNEDDMLDAMIKLQGSSESIFGKKV